MKNLLDNIIAFYLFPKSKKNMEENSFPRASLLPFPDNLKGTNAKTQKKINDETKKTNDEIHAFLVNQLSKITNQ